jgi:hypothetical protein
MTHDQIAKFLEPGHLGKHLVKIQFKSRQPVNGLFLVTKDYEELKSKNFWRIVTERNFEKWRETGDNELARIFNGVEFTRLTAPSKS